MIHMYCFQVSPPYDTTGTTALTAANLLFEMLCVLPGVIYKSWSRVYKWCRKTDKPFLDGTK